MVLSIFISKNLSSISVPVFVFLRITAAMDIMHSLHQVKSREPTGERILCSDYLLGVCPYHVLQAVSILLLLLVDLVIVLVPDEDGGVVALHLLPASRLVVGWY